MNTTGFGKQVTSSSTTTEGDGLRVAAAERVSVYDVQISNAYKQASQFKNLTIEFMRTCR